MEEDVPIKEKKSFLRNDRKLVCSMFVVYGLCILGLVTATIWGLDRRNKKISADATLTAAGLATEQAKYQLMDRFDTNKNNWHTGPENNDHWIGSRDIVNGVYVWDIDQVKQDFVFWEDLYPEEKSEDFDAYVDIKIVEGSLGEVCSGLIFRKSFVSWDNGGYVFFVCNDLHYEVHYHGRNGWEAISGDYSDAIRALDWNRIQVSARRNYFTLNINGVGVFEMTDNRQQTGGLAIFVQTRDKNPAVVWFDNVAYQSR